MSFTSTYMGLTVWNLLSDLFDHTQLEGDLVALDAHDHTTGKGKQIPTGGIADGAITTSKIASGAITSGLLGTGVVEGVNIDPTTNVTIAGLTVTGNETVNGTLTVNNGIFGLLVTTAVNTNLNPAVNSHLYLYYGTGGHTITLPSPVNGAMIGVTCVKQTLSGALTVTASSGKVYGLGISAAGSTSIKLGTTGAYVILQSDGANWYIIAGKPDTGWLNMTAASGFTASGCQVRQVGNEVYMRGTVINTSPINNGSSVVSLATFPAGIAAATGTTSLGIEAVGGFIMTPGVGLLGTGITLISSINVGTGSGIWFNASSLTD